MKIVKNLGRRIDKKPLTREQIREYKDAFRTFDTNGDGKISYKELRAFLKLMGQNPTDYDVKKIMMKVDRDGSGTIEFNEFVTMMMEESDQTTPCSTHFRKIFNSFDVDGNGLITVKEFKKGVTRLGEKLSDKKVKKIMKEVDLDGDGCINFDEFVRMLTK